MPKIKKITQYLGKKCLKTFGTYSPVPLPPFNVQKKVKKGKTKIPQNFWISVLPPPHFGQCPKERRLLYGFLKKKRKNSENKR